MQLNPGEGSCGDAPTNGISTAVPSLFLTFSVAKLTEMTGYIETCCSALDDEQIWRRGGPHENAIGNLLLHLCGNVKQYILHGVAGERDFRIRETAFSASEVATGHSYSTSSEEPSSKPAG